MSGAGNLQAVSFAGRHRAARAPGPPSLATPLLLVPAVWSLLALGRVAVERLGPGAGVLACFAAVTVLVVAISARRSKLAARHLLTSALGLAGGVASFPAWVACIVWAGLAGGLEPRSPTAHFEADLAFTLAVVVLAPIFEELLYRDRLLIALRARVGSLLAVAICALLFALPHIEPWSVFGALLVGFALGGLRLLSRSLVLCMALHAGLNLAALAGGAAPAGLALSPLTSLWLGILLLSLATCVARGRGGWRSRTSRPS